MSKDEGNVQIPDIIYDENTKISYKKGRFFGKGGFAKCYEITNMTTSHAYAGKIVSKKLMVKENQKQKMTQEIQIHQSLKHKNVVGFYSFFEDSFNIYIVLELCRKRLLLDLALCQNNASNSVAAVCSQVKGDIQWIDKDMLVNAINAYFKMPSINWDIYEDGSFPMMLHDIISMGKACAAETLERHMVTAAEITKDVLKLVKDMCIQLDSGLTTDNLSDLIDIVTKTVKSEEDEVSRLIKNAILEFGLCFEIGMPRLMQKTFKDALTSVS